MKSGISLAAIALIAFFVVQAAHADEPITESSTAGLLLYKPESQAQAFAYATAALKTHAIAMVHRTFLANAYDTSEKLRSARPLAAANGDRNVAVDILARGIKCEAIPGTLLLQIRCDPSVIDHDGAAIINEIGDCYIQALMGSANDKTANDLDTAKKWQDRYGYELNRISERMAKLAQELDRAKKTDADGKPNFSAELELRSLQDEAKSYRDLKREMEDRVGKLKSQFTDGRAQLSWLRQPYEPADSK